MTGAFLFSAGIRASIETYITATLPGWFLKMMLIALQIPKALSQKKYFKLKKSSPHPASPPPPIISFLPDPNEILLCM